MVAASAVRGLMVGQSGGCDFRKWSSAVTLPAPERKYAVERYRPRGPPRASWIGDACAVAWIYPCKRLAKAGQENIFMRVCEWAKGSLLGPWPLCLTLVFR